MEWTAAWGILASGTSFLFIWPQVIRVFRYKTVEGLSAVGVLVNLCSFSNWLIYGIHRHDWILLAANIQAIIGTIIITAMISKAGHLPWKYLLPVATSILISVNIANFNVDVQGICSVIFTTSTALPQLVHTLRNKRDLKGVSVMTYLLWTGNGLLWMIYGFSILDPIIIAPQVILIPCQLIIAAVAYSAQKRESPGFAH